MTPRKKPEDFKKHGRPSTYKPDYDQLLIDHMAQGLSFRSFAGHPQVKSTIETIYNWCELFPSFLDAKRHGEARSLLVWESAGNISALRDKEMSWTGWYMNMKNRFKWHDQMRVETDQKIKQEITVDHTPKKAKIKELLDDESAIDSGKAAQIIKGN